MRLASARWVVPIATPPIAEGAVLLDDDGATVLAVGRGEDLRRAHPHIAEERAEGILVPGLVNAHTHLELSALAGQVPGGDGVIPWTRRLLGRLAETAAAVLEKAACDAAVAAIGFGTAAIADVGNGVAGYRALAAAGLAGVFFHELVGSREARTGDAIRDAADERARIPAAERPMNVAAVAAPHAPYSVGPALLRRIFAGAARDGAATSIHLAEDAEELHLLRDGTGGWPPVLRAMGVEPGERTPGMGPVEYLASAGAFTGTRPPLLVHMVHAGADDLHRAATAGATVVLCPRSNLHIGGRLPDVPAALAAGVRLAIGTDSLASTADLSLWGELATLAARFPRVAPAVWLRAATEGGAAALGMGSVGALAVGRRPGVLDVAPAGGDDADPERALVTDPNPRIRWMAHA
jgi:cytosine/adenosine deaminase-related metal-dependent hydrolase